MILMSSEEEDLVQELAKHSVRLTFAVCYLAGAIPGLSDEERVKLHNLASGRMEPEEF